MTEDVKLWSEVRERELWFVISLDRTARGCVGMFNIPDSHAWRVDVLVFQFVLRSTSFRLFFALSTCPKAPDGINGIERGSQQEAQEGWKA